MGVWKADEYLLEALFCEVLAKVAHSVCPNNSDMVKFGGLFDSIPSNLFSNEVDQFISDLKS